MKTRMSTKNLIVFVAMTVALIIYGALSIWEPWQRQPVVFYCPIFLPLEVINGDLIVFGDGTQLVIDGDKRINEMQYKDGKVTINATVRKNLWQILTK